MGDGACFALLGCSDLVEFVSRQSSQVIRAPGPGTTGEDETRRCGSGRRVKFGSWADIRWLSCGLACWFWLFRAGKLNCTHGRCNWNDNG